MEDSERGSSVFYWRTVREVLMCWRTVREVLVFYWRTVREVLVCSMEDSERGSHVLMLHVFEEA